MKGLNVSATETMLLLALRQKNWKVAAEILEELDKKERNCFFSALKSAVSQAEQEDKTALFLLNLWTEVSWKIKIKK